MLVECIKDGFIKKDVDITIIDEEYCIIIEIFNENNIKICDVMESQNFYKIINLVNEFNVVENLKDLFFDDKSKKLIYG